MTKLTLKGFYSRSHQMPSEQCHQDQKNQGGGREATLARPHPRTGSKLPHSVEKKKMV